MLRVLRNLTPYRFPMHIHNRSPHQEKGSRVCCGLGALRNRLCRMEEGIRYVSSSNHPLPFFLGHSSSIPSAALIAAYSSHPLKPLLSFCTPFLRHSTKWMMYVEGGSDTQLVYHHHMKEGKHDTAGDFPLLRHIEFLPLNTTI